MKKLLYIDSCVLRETSRTKRIADALVEHLLSTGELVLEQLVLEDLGLLPLTSRRWYVAMNCVTRGTMMTPCLT